MNIERLVLGGERSAAAAGKLFAEVAQAGAVDAGHATTQDST